jgi:15-hydroxyprostaglandin dehydrogenase (NAD)
MKKLRQLEFLKRREKELIDYEEEGIPLYSKCYTCPETLHFMTLFVSEAFQRTIETFGTLDIVVNNAGILNESEWEKEVDINLVGHICLYCIYCTFTEQFTVQTCDN